MEKEEDENGLIIVSAMDQEIRLDKLLTQKFPAYSRTYFQYLIASGLVLVDGKQVRKRELLMCGSEIEIAFAATPEISLEPEAIALDILFEDDQLIAVNKPSGLVVHPAPGHWSGTFVNALLFHCKNLKNFEGLRPGIVHRLDKETTGVLIAAKTERMHGLLVEAFANRQMHKEYLAICYGNPGDRLITGGISRHPVKRKEMVLNTTHGKESVTYCKTLCQTSPLSLVRLVPKTGRTHQIRVHLKSIGTAILGDSLYGIRSVNERYSISRQYLHAEMLKFIHPLSKKEIVLKAPIPDDMQDFIKRYQWPTDAYSDSKS